MIMRIILFLILMLVFVGTVFFPTGGLIGSQGDLVSPDLSIQKEISSVPLQSALESDQQDAIFSKTTIVTLVLAVLGVVIFRQHSFN